ncbi:hypothetical protein APA44_03105 [Pseudomonas aeruginosa]|nr:hypothetical protein AO882_03105 [Pseudomonas paraeruginosa]KSL20770.1 hypothetical protein APA44_03105 [Pseudomonas aeruginosa]OKR53545.1 hypothetical protein BH596_18625 [Pseudomonas aeruginosa]
MGMRSSVGRGLEDCWFLFRLIESFGGRRVAMHSELTLQHSNTMSLIGALSSGLCPNPPCRGLPEGHSVPRGL